MNQYVFITGVSTGIGYATAVLLVQRGYHVFGSVRREEDGARLRAELGERITPLLFDVTDEAGVATAVAHIRATLNGQNLAGLINNAGISIAGPLMHLPLAKLRQQFAVNLFGLMDVTQQCLPLLGAAKAAPYPRGRIINISSVAGQIAYPFVGAYTASKHALEGLSDSLRRELLIYDIPVILIQPGTTATPIVAKVSAGMQQYGHTDYAPILQKLATQTIREREQHAVPVVKVAATIVQALESPRPKTRYAIPSRWLLGWLLPRSLPDRWFDWLVARQMEKGD